MPAELLTLEITESSVMSDPVGALEQLSRLKGLGTRLSVDDFGTGHSSLALPPASACHEVKVDKSFVLPMARDDTAPAIVAAMVVLAHRLGLLRHAAARPPAVRRHRGWRGWWAHGSTTSQRQEWGTAARLAVDGQVDEIGWAAALLKIGGAIRRSRYYTRAMPHGTVERMDRGGVADPPPEPLGTADVPATLRARQMPRRRARPAGPATHLTAVAGRSA